MSKYTEDFIALEDLGMAYRKTKVDMFYSPRICRRELLEFEENLESNLKKLKRKIINGKAPNIGKTTWTIAPKGITPNESDQSLIFSDPQQQWQNICKSASKPQAEFRVMEQLSVEFHVFATLWIQKVGNVFESKLSDVACGNRLRRSKAGNLNPLSLGSTVPYLYAYCKWRDDGITAMHDALEADKEVVAITADVSSFYHKLDVGFMLDDKFHKTIGVMLDNDQKQLNELFIKKLKLWAKNTPIKQGLPVGLIASAGIANLALFELDRIIQGEIAPLYYGRYVDDIILVMENGSKFKTSEDVWEWLFKRSNKSLSWVNKKEKNVISFSQSYLKNSEIHFANEKNKVFLLSGDTGKTTLASIRHQIQMRTSEWRALPNMPHDSTQIESRLLTAIQANGEGADSLRKADKLSVRRAGFAIKLRDIEAYARALPAESWEMERHSFFDAFIRHILVLPTFFDFYNYLSRVIQLATCCGDFEYLRQIIDALEEILKSLDDCDLTLKAVDAKSIKSLNLLPKFTGQLKDQIAQSIELAFLSSLTCKQRLLWKKHFSKNLDLFETKAVAELQKTNRNLFQRDLAHRPFRQLILPKEMIGNRKLPIKKKNTINLRQTSRVKLLFPCISAGVKVICKTVKMSIKQGLPVGFLFATRPLNLNELYILHHDPFSDNGCKDISDCILALRGFKPEKELPKKRKDQCIEIQYDKQKTKIRIAVASWKTDDKSWIASITEDVDPDTSRLSRLNHLLNAVLKTKEKPDYLILPELSIPLCWFLSIAGKLQSKGISLISGVEYQHASGKKVRSQIWAALSHDALGFPSMMIYRQDKQRPALHEESELKRIGNVVLKPEESWKTPPIVSHGGFHFSCLLCSELTNIIYRAAVRGKVDALFIPEWNRDTDSFNPLIESAALDIHAYIIQCNDRAYGDSRIRAPYKESWKRDVVRIKGGLEDYFVVGEIDIQAIRKFQSSHRSPDKPFKPVPDGFKIDYNRKVLPEVNK